VNAQAVETSGGGIRTPLRNRLRNGADDTSKISGDGGAGARRHQWLNGGWSPA